MTTSATSPAGASVHPRATQRRATNPTLRRAGFLAAVAVVAALTAGLRLFHQSQAYELFVDEIQYGDVANSFAAGHGPQLFGDPFFLHPPLFFAYLAALQGGSVDRMTVAHMLALRPLVVVFAVLNCLLVVAIARRFTGRRNAVVAGALYALDPFVVRFDSRVMLEAPTLTATLLGVLAGLVAVESTGRRRLGLLLLAGAAFGIAVTTKSTSALITTVPLLMMLVFGVGPRRIETLGILVVQTAVYGCYVGWVAATGRFGLWFHQTVHGVVRATARPQTGFNAPTAPSFGSRLVAQLAQFGPSYLLIGLAVGAILLFVVEGMRPRLFVGKHAVPFDGATGRMLTCWLGGLLLAVGYTSLFGEVEEQTYYLMAVPATIVVAVLAARVASMVGRVAVSGVIVVALLWSGQVWWVVHTQPDDAYARLVAYIAPLGGPGVTIALGESTGQFVLPGFGLVPLNGPVAPKGARYALVSTELSALGLSKVTPADIAALDHRYALNFVARGRTVGELRLYDVTKAPS